MLVAHGAPRAGNRDRLMVPVRADVATRRGQPSWGRAGSDSDPLVVAQRPSVAPGSIRLRVVNTTLRRLKKALGPHRSLRPQHADSGGALAGE